MFENFKIFLFIFYNVLLDKEIFENVLKNYICEN